MLISQMSWYKCLISCRIPTCRAKYKNLAWYQLHNSGLNHGQLFGFYCGIKRSMSERAHSEMMMAVLEVFFFSRTRERGASTMLDLKLSQSDISINCLSVNFYKTKELEKSKERGKEDIKEERQRVNMKAREKMEIKMAERKGGRYVDKIHKEAGLLH